jgi:uncharacterized protein (DUF2235 family)
MHKNIVILSDGTGNSAAKPFKTNVWRLYQALDIAEPDDEKLNQQIVYYDGGVGTENFKPLAALGGALGLGVWANVKDLYTYVCRNYDVGDDIYGFGFSRGAFTVRLLMGLIGRCGIVKARPDSEAALLDAVQMAYEAYRRDFLIRASRERMMIYHWFLNPPLYDEIEGGKKGKTINLRDFDGSPVASQAYPPIRLVGVWDTVDAYGMPVDELKNAIDRWVWPMSFADRNLSDSVSHARHALSLDDERPTFRPVLWNEVPSGRMPLGADRIQQVWFAGVHANVGGGYADDGLAYVALDWMMSEAATAGLRYWQDAHQEVYERANPHGEQYDSRSGIAAYYRYGPRQVQQLCNDPEHGVNVPAVRVHDSVFDRIAAHQVKYAPVSLNCPFGLIGGTPEKYPDKDFLKPDEGALIEAWRGVRRRRIAYFSTVALTIYLVFFLLPHFGAGLVEAIDWVLKPFQPIPSYLIDFLTQGWSLVAVAMGWLVSWLPQSVRSGFDAAIDGVLAFALSPWTALAAVTVLAWLFFKKSGELQNAIQARAEWAWAAQKGLPETSRPAVATTPSQSLDKAGVYPWKTPKILIDVLGVAIGILMIVPLGLIALWRLTRRKPWLAKHASVQKRE